VTRLPGPGRVGPLVQLSVIHPRDDIRVRVRGTETLALAFDRPMHLLVMDGRGDSSESEGRVQVHDLGSPPRSRILRMLLGPWKAFQMIRILRPAVVHFHNPELLPLAVGLSWLGCKVVYDAHEDMPRQIMAKHWVPRWARGSVARVTATVEFLASRRMDAVVAAWPGIAERFPADRTVLVRNFPPIGELASLHPVPHALRRPAFAYVGGISEVRGIREMVEAVGRVGSPGTSIPRLLLGGRFAPALLESEVSRMAGWERVDFRGWVDRTGVSDILGQSRAGLMTLHPTPNHLRSEPNKLFEYMSAGLPVVVSDFPVWRAIVEEAECGLMVDPFDVDAIASAMQWILDHPEEAEAMGRRGREAVESKWNWEGEGERLVELYRRLVPGLR
jgi:glycosyltransferase involved in cell wall biosynthesis